MQSNMLDFEDCMDLETMQLVNPYEIYPIAETSSGLPKVSLNPDYILSQKNDVITQNTLKMEGYSDISALLSPDSIDEFTTNPVIDDGIFDYNLTPASDNKKVKVEYNAQYYSLCTDVTAANDNAVQNSISEPVVGNDTNDFYLCQHQSFTHDTNYYGNGIEDSYNGASFNTSDSITTNNDKFIIMNCNSTATSPQDDRYSLISSPGVKEEFMDLQMYVEDPNLKKERPKLNLMTDEFKLPIKLEGPSTLNTPDVIDEVFKMRNDFDIFKLISNEDIKVLNGEEFFQSLCDDFPPPSSPPTPPVGVKTPPKKRKHSVSEDDDDGDEDYVPPQRKKVAATTTTSSRLPPDMDSDYSNSSADDYWQHKVKKPRGRPPKRTDSVSSDVASKSQGVTKYRELRDKNNEASRRSRQKRKEKDQEYEKDAKELTERNIKLKAEVEQLEKMVSTFRKNLFEIIAKK